MESSERNQRVSELLMDIDALQAELSGRLQMLAAVVTASNASPNAVPASRLVVDEARFSVGWEGASCYLGYTIPFKLLRRLARRPNHFVSCDQLRQDVWLGVDRADSTIRSEVRHLRRKLVAAGCGELAAKLCGRNGHYALLL